MPTRLLHDGDEVPEWPPAAPHARRRCKEAAGRDDFTNDSDVGRVAELYKRFFDAATSTTRAVVVMGLALLSVVLLLRSSLAAGSVKHARPLSFCFPSTILPARPSFVRRIVTAMPESVSTARRPTGIPANEQHFICAAVLFLTHSCRGRDASHFFDSRHVPMCPGSSFVRQVSFHANDHR